MEIKSSDEGSQIGEVDIRETVKPFLGILVCLFIEPTFRDVVTDFSTMAHDNPAKLTLNRDS